LGKAPWGTHFCQFYKTKEDLIEILVPYLKTGLKNNEFCMWVTSEPLKAKAAKDALRKELEDLDDYIEKGQIEILDANQWYSKSGRFEAKNVLEGWVEKEEQSVNRGFDGLRLTGNTFWLEKKDWRNFVEYEETINSIIRNYRMLAICSYSLDRCGPIELIEVALNHQFVFIKHESKWEIFESSERKQVQEKLEENELFNFILFEYNPIETMVVNREGKVIRLNLAKKNSGQRLPRIGDVMYRDWPEEHKIDMHAELMKCIKLGKTKRFSEVKYDDKFFSITMSGFPRGAIITSQDITERKLAEEEKERLQVQLIQSERMAGIGTLASGIAHEFNNLLQIMMGHTEFAQRTKKADVMEEALDIVMNTTVRTKKIIEDVLSFSKSGAPEKELCDIAELIKSVLSLTEEHFKKNNIRAVIKYGRVPKIEVNKGEIQQVFLNLVTNARDAMSPRGGKLEIEIKKVEDNVEISFADTGKGIEEENLSRVFEPFYTTKGAVGGDTRIQGIGLGLSVSYGIVERHRGTIEVESEVGRGTTFTIRLPVIVEKAEKRIDKEERKKKPEKIKPLKVLVVDDEEEICKLLTKWLSSEGHNVKSALTGKKALDLVKKESFDVVFLDIVMPGIPAIDTLAEIKNNSPETKVKMITGTLLDKESWKELRKRGADGYLVKPFKIEDIKNYIASIEN
jgi:signal transduction histidine kinase